MREYEMGETVRFSIMTRDAAGALKAADSTPQYRVYEDLGVSEDPILGPTSLTAAQRTGHYFCEIALTSGNGFSIDGRYTVEIEATVDSKTDGLSMDFEVTSRLGRLNNKVDHTVETGVGSGV